MNEIQLHLMQEDEAFGNWLIEAIATPLGIRMNKDATSLIASAIYKGTACGAWVVFDKEGIMVGSIVEGSDAEFSERISLTGLQNMNEEEAAITLNKRFYQALKRIEHLVEEVNQALEEEEPPLNPNQFRL